MFKIERRSPIGKPIFIKVEYETTSGFDEPILTPEIELFGTIHPRIYYI